MFPQQLHFSLFPIFTTLFHKLSTSTGSSWKLLSDKTSWRALLKSPFLMQFNASRRSESFSTTEWGTKPLIQRKKIVWRLVSRGQVFVTWYSILELGGLYLYDHWIAGSFSRAVRVRSYQEKVYLSYTNPYKHKRNWCFSLQKEELNQQLDFQLLSLLMMALPSQGELFSQE